MNIHIDANDIEKIGVDSDATDNAFFDGQQYLMFLLGDEFFALDILSVKEINGWDSATVIPNSPDYVKGVTNLRGTIVPIIDLRIRFQVGAPNFISTTVVVILSKETDAGQRTVGFVVDAVSDVLDIKDEEIQLLPDFDGTVPENYIYGIANFNDNVVTVLDVAQLISLDDLG